MDERIRKLFTPEECEIFERNALASHRPDLAAECRRRAVELRAEKYGAETLAEKECLEAVFAYEKVLTDRRGRTIRASCTWQMIDKHGVLAPVERVVSRPEDATGFTALLEMGLENFAFEAVVLRYPNSFSSEAVKRSRERVDEWQRT
ncbi:MAG: hypothetical protein ACT4P0_13630 [Panacagrimonas sp.]